MTNNSFASYRPVPATGSLSSINDIDIQAIATAALHQTQRQEYPAVPGSYQYADNLPSEQNTLNFWPSSHPDHAAGKGTSQYPDSFDHEILHVSNPLEGVSSRTSSVLLSEARSDSISSFPRSATPVTKQAFSDPTIKFGQTQVSDYIWKPEYTQHELHSRETELTRSSEIDRRFERSQKINNIQQPEQTRQASNPQQQPYHYHPDHLQSEWTHRARNRTVDSTDPHICYICQHSCVRIDSIRRHLVAFHDLRQEDIGKIWRRSQYLDAGIFPRFDSMKCPKMTVRRVVPKTEQVVKKKYIRKPKVTADSIKRVNTEELKALQTDISPAELYVIDSSIAAACAMEPALAIDKLAKICKAALQHISEKHRGLIFQEHWPNADYPGSLYADMGDEEESGKHNEVKS